MAKQQELYRDPWGVIIAAADGRHIEIIWTDDTAQMSGEDFVPWLERFAGFVEDGRYHTVLVDARHFRMNPADLSMDWRDRQIIPRYNAGGLKKFAFVMPPGMPAIGSAPTAEGLAEFPTGYFGELADAYEWLDIKMT